MEWTTLTFEGHRICPCVCPPNFAEARKQYVLEKHGTSVKEEASCPDVVFDFGGMCRFHETYNTFEIGDGRTVSCMKHQVSELVTMLKYVLSKETKSQDSGLFRVRCWPHRLIFLSREDIGIILKEIDKQTDPAAREAEALAHNISCKEVLVAANMVNRPASEEPTIRAILNAKKPEEA